MRKTYPAGIEKIKQWEGLKLSAYQDSGGVWTIGYGHTGNVRPNDQITADRAEALLVDDLAWAEKAVATGVTVDLTDAQFAALVSFTFNVGAEAFRKSTLRKRLNAGEYDAVPSELAKWNKVTVEGKKVVVPGLSNRRAAEAGLWVSGAHVASQNVTPAPAPAVITKETVGAVITGATSILAVAQSGGPLVWFIGPAFLAVTIGAVIWFLRRERTAAGLA